MRAYFDVRSLVEVFEGTPGLTLKITQTSIYKCMSTYYLEMMNTKIIYIMSGLALVASQIAINTDNSRHIKIVFL